MSGSCKNALQEVEYNVFLKKMAADQVISKTDYYEVLRIEANVVVQTEVTASPGLPDTGLITQKYSVNFLTEVDPTLRQAKSGNPGYLHGKPMLMAFPSISEPGARELFEDGFKLMGADKNGKCKAKTTLAS